MTKNSEVTRKKFDRLLSWLNEDEEIAAEKYMSVHRILVQFFSARGAFPADELADRVMDISAKKIDFLINDYKGEPLLVFHSVAKKVLLENLRKPKGEPLDERLIRNHMADEKNHEQQEAYLQCLSECLRKLPPQQRKLFLKYFQYGGQKKIDYHKKLAQEMGLDIRALRTRVHRIKTSLEKSVTDCVRRKNV